MAAVPVVEAAALVVLVLAAPALAAVGNLCISLKFFSGFTIYHLKSLFP
jgi:hypothetical protein